MANCPAISKFVVPILCLFVAGASGQERNETRLTGAVNDAASAPVAGVSVLLSSLDRVLQTKSDTAGRFQFDDVPPGLYQLDLSAPGFVEQSLPVDLTSGSQSVVIVLKIGSMPDMKYCGPHPSIAYKPPSAMSPRLDGLVRDYDHRSPVSNATVTVSRSGQQVSMHRSDRAGKFTFNDLPAGHYDLLISRPGYWKAEVKGLLLPRENGASVEIPILKRNQIVVCQ